MLSSTFPSPLNQNAKLYIDFAKCYLIILMPNLFFCFYFLLLFIETLISFRIPLLFKELAGLNNNNSWVKGKDLSLLRHQQPLLKNNATH